MIKFNCILKKVTSNLLLLFLFFTKNTFAEFSEHQNGIIDEIQQSDIGSKTIYLTLDACGGRRGSIPDKKLIKFLIKNGIKTTLFINKRFLEKNSAYINKYMILAIFQYKIMEVIIYRLLWMVKLYTVSKEQLI